MERKKSEGGQEKAIISPWGLGGVVCAAVVVRSCIDLKWSLTTLRRRCNSAGGCLPFSSLISVMPQVSQTGSISPAYRFDVCACVWRYAWQRRFRWTSPTPVSRYGDRVSPLLSVCPCRTGEDWQVSLSDSWNDCRILFCPSIFLFFYLFIFKFS